jgi:hypothetical protein
MMNLVVNNYIDAVDEEEFINHRAKASTMDIGDFTVPRLDIPMPSEMGTPIDMSDDEDDSTPPAHLDAIVQSYDIPPLQAWPPAINLGDPQGTPGGYTGSSAGTTQDVAPARTSGADVLGTPGGCSTSHSPRMAVVPKMETLDILDQRSRPSLDLFRNTRRRMKKTPYVELPPGAIIDVSDEDEGDMDIMSELGVEYDRNKRVKEEALTVAELNSKLEQKMKEEMAAAEEKSARHLARLQEELRASAAKTDAIFEMLSRMQSQSAPPQQPYPYPPQPPQARPYSAGPSNPPAPHPTPAGSPLPLELTASASTSHDPIQAAMREDEDLRTSVRESSGPSALPPPTSRVGQPSGTDRVVDRRGHDPAQHTDMVIVEDAQGSPIDAAGVQAMELESPERERLPSSRTVDVPMETLDLGGESDDADIVQQTQASQAVRQPEAVETEAPAPMEVTNERSLIEAEGAARSSAAAPPPDDEVTLL